MQDNKNYISSTALTQEDIYKWIGHHMNLSQLFSLPDKPFEYLSWRDKDDNITDDKKKLHHKVKAELSRARQAENEDDFKLVFQNVLQKESLSDTDDNKRYLIPRLIKEVDRLIGLYELPTQKLSDLDHPLLICAEKFKAWLNMLNPAESISTGIVSPESVDTYTHRVHVLANWYKHDAGLESKNTPKELKAVSSRRYTAYRELLGTNKKFNRPRRKEELETLLEYLKDFPTAISLVQKDLKDGNYKKNSIPDPH